MSLETLFNAPSDSRLERLVFTARQAINWVTQNFTNTDTGQEPLALEQNSAVVTTVEATQCITPATEAVIDAAGYGKLYRATRRVDPNAEKFVSREYPPEQLKREAEIAQNITKLLKYSAKNEQIKF